MSFPEGTQKECLFQSPQQGSLTDVLVQSLEFKLFKISVSVAKKELKEFFKFQVVHGSACLLLCNLQFHFIHITSILNPAVLLR